MRRLALAATAAAALAGCAPDPEQIEAAFVSPTAFASLSCAQLANELAVIEPRLQDLVVKQDTAAAQDAVIVTGAVLLIPIAGLMAVGGPDYSGDISSMRGQVAAIEAAARARGC